MCSSDLLEVPIGLSARGVWLVPQDAPVEGPRLLWERHPCVHMALFGKRWFVSDTGGDITCKLPTVHVQCHPDHFPPLNRVCASSIGHFVAHVEHRAHGRHCRRWLLLHHLHDASTFRTTALAPWQRVQYRCSSVADVHALFERVEQAVDWSVVRGFVTSGVFALPAGLRHGCEWMNKADVAEAEEEAKRKGAAAAKPTKKKKKKKVQAKQTKCVTTEDAIRSIEEAFTVLNKRSQRKKRKR